MRNGWNWKYPLSYMYPAHTQLLAKCSSPSIGDRRATGYTASKQSYTPWRSDEHIFQIGIFNNNIKSSFEAENCLQLWDFDWTDFQQNMFWNMKQILFPSFSHKSSSHDTSGQLSSFHAEPIQRLWRLLARKKYICWDFLVKIVQGNHFHKCCFRPRKNLISRKNRSQNF